MRSRRSRSMQPPLTAKAGDSSVLEGSGGGIMTRSQTSQADGLLKLLGSQAYDTVGKMKRSTFCLNHDTSMVASLSASAIE